MRTVTYYDAEFDEIYLDGVRIVDVGDADMVHARPDACLSSIEAVTAKILDRGAMPVTLGGDHAVTIPLVQRRPTTDRCALSRSTRISISSTNASVFARGTAT